MSFIGGYQSDINLSNLSYVGDFPVEHNIGGYGIATGNNNTYYLNLIPAISQYRPGMLLAVSFLVANTGAATININGKGSKPLLKVTAGTLGNLDPADITLDKIFILVYDGSSFQVANSAAYVTDASEQRKGIAQIASDAEVAAGIDNTKFVTPAKLLAYVGNKITGLWENKGTLDCSTNPPYPDAFKGHAYTVSAAGKIGGVDGVAVQLRDVVYCTTTNHGGLQAATGDNWNIIQANLEQATEILAGYARLATVAEVIAGTDGHTIVTPASLKAFIQTLPPSGGGGASVQSASETVAGILEIATQAEADAGTDDLRAITPLKLAAYVAGKITGLWKDKGLLDCSANPPFPPALKGDAYTVRIAGKIGGPDGLVVEVRDVIYCEEDNLGGFLAGVPNAWNVLQANLVQATETIAGYAKIATQAEAIAGQDTQKFITPATLSAALASQHGASVPNASEAQAGILPLATYDDADNESDDTKAVTVAKMAYFVYNRLYSPSLATENNVGLSKVANQTEVTTGTNDSNFVTPLKLMTLLNTKIKKMRTQIKFTAPTLPETESYSGGTSGDQFMTYIPVIGLPASFTLYQATLSFEGNHRMIDSGHGENYVNSGQLTIDVAAQSYTVLNLAGKVRKSTPGSSFFKLVGEDILGSNPGINFNNGLYRVYISSMNSQYGGFLFTGTWSLELDFEPL